jgi:hypothetical protein
MYKGSVTIKKIHLINMLENQKIIFRSRISDDSKMIAWGGEIVLDRILEGDISNYDWNEVIQRIWDYGTIKPRDLFKIIVGGEEDKE